MIARLRRWLGEPPTQNHQRLVAHAHAHPEHDAGGAQVRRTPTVQFDIFTLFFSLISGYIGELIFTVL